MQLYVISPWIVLYYTIYIVVYYTIYPYMVNYLVYF